MLAILDEFRESLDNIMLRIMHSSILLQQESILILPMLMIGLNYSCAKNI